MIKFSLHELKNGGQLMSLLIRNFGVILLIVGLVGCLDDNGKNVSETNATGVGERNAAPSVSALLLTNAVESEEYRFIPSASDPDGDVLQFAIENLPSWASFNANTGELKGIPSSDDVNVYSDISISVSDGENVSVLAPFDISVIRKESVEDENSVPTIIGRAPGGSKVGDLYNFTPISHDADGDELSFQITNKPLWAEFDKSTGQLVGTPTEKNIGDFKYIIIAVSDGKSLVVLPEFHIRVTDKALEGRTPEEATSEVTTPEETMPEETTPEETTPEETTPEETTPEETTPEEATPQETTPEEVDNAAPSIPSMPSLVSVGHSSATLSWTASTDDTEVVGYRVYRDDVELSTTISLMYSDLDLSASTLYRYAVSAFDAEGNESSQSELLEVTTSVIEVGACEEQTGTAVAIPFKFVTPVEVGKYVTLAATSTLVEFNKHSVEDIPNVNWSRRYKAYKYGNGGAAIDVWKINNAPLNGVLYEGLSALNDGDVVSEPDDLVYVPHDGYVGIDTFSYCVFDSTGQSNIAEVAVQVAPTNDYPMPYGVVNPGFGIDEQPPADPTEWSTSTEKVGFYYIDSDHPSCNNTNDYGYPDAPRCSIPSSGASVVAGGKMVLAPSSLPYTMRDSSWQLINFEGTADNPSWLIGNDKGPDRPVILSHANRVDSRVTLRITGSFLRISGVVFDGPSLQHRGGGAENVVVRHSEFKNYPSTAGGGTTVGLSTEGRNVLAFNVYAHDNGIVEEDGLSTERDIHAFVGTNQQGYWMLDIRCDENAGDCVQLTNNNTTSDVFVGRMVAHSEGENCIDIKDFNRVVVSESDCWDIRQVQYGNSGGNGQNFYVNDEGVQQNYVYMLNNRSWDTAGTNYGASNIGGRVYMIGNISFASPNAEGFNSGGGGGARYIYFNTFVDNRIGIYHYGSGSSLDRYIVGNVVDGTSQYNTRLQASTNVIDLLDYNYYVQSGSYASGGSTANNYSDLNDFNGSLGFENNSVEGLNTSYTAKHTYDFVPLSMSDLSAAIPVSIVEALPLLNDLANDLSVSFRDRFGRSRSDSSSDYDAGALKSSD